MEIYFLWLIKVFSLFSFREKISLFLAVWERSYLLYNTHIKNVFLPFSTQVVANAIDYGRTKTK